MRFATYRKLNSLSLFLLAFILICFSWQPIPLFNPSKARAASQTFTTSGSWVAPAGVTSVLVEAWGGGGAGGGRGSTNGQSGGGGGGAFASATVTVIPSQSYGYTVGAGVAGGTANGSDGSFSQWETGAQVKAAGGKGGLSTTTKGLGGSIAESVGTVIYKGGDGADAISTISGGGGGGAGTTGVGGNAANGTAGTGTAVGGGSGGAGVTNASGNPGLVVGGGGSGARRTSGNRNGGNGAAGQIRITYNAAPVITVNTTDSPDPVNFGSNVTFSATATDTEHSWKLVVCKTNSVTPGLNPTCASGETVCVSSTATASGASNSCVWTSNQTTNLSWYSFACDNTASMPSCSTANTANAPLAVNVIISVSITTDGTINYGTLNSGQSRSTLELGDTQTARNDTNIAEDFNIKTSAPAGWTVSANPGSDAFVHEFSINGGSNWIKFSAAESYQTLVSDIMPNATQNFDMRLTSPNPSTSGGQKSIDITIQAVQH